MSMGWQIIGLSFSGAFLKILVFDIGQVIRIRTGETDAEAL